MRTSPTLIASAVGFCFTVATCFVAFSGDVAMPAAVAAPVVNVDDVAVAGKAVDAPAALEEVFAGPISPSDPTLHDVDQWLPEYGALQGFARTWVSDASDTGYTVYDWEFPEADYAIAARDDSFGSFVEEGAREFAVGDGVRAAVVMGDTARAWWVEGTSLHVVDFSAQFTSSADAVASDVTAIVKASRS